MPQGPNRLRKAAPASADPRTVLHGGRVRPAWELAASHLALLVLLLAPQAAARAQPVAVVACGAPQIVRAPYVWKHLPTADGSPRIEATLPGAYLRATFGNTSKIGLIVDGSGNDGCPPESMPVIEFSVDERPFQTAQLSKFEERYVVPLADNLSPDQPHRVEVYFRAADLTRQRWTAPTARLRLAGFQLDAGGETLSTMSRPKLAIAFGDSITEGVGVDGLFDSWQSLGVNSARTAWFPIVAAALDCEYGQLGSGGQGMVRGLELPPLPETWHRFDNETSRLIDGRLKPEPDLVFCAMGTNDFEKNIALPYGNWLQAMRRACPTTHIFCIVPPLGVHADEIRQAVATRQSAGDARVHLVDTASLTHAFRAGQGATQLAADGVHPTLEGQSKLAALVTAAAVDALATVPLDVQRP